MIRSLLFILLFGCLNLQAQELYKKNGLYIHNAHQWQVDKYDQDVMSKGDCIYNTCRKIIDEQDRSEWAYNALEICADLLKQNKRWPDWMNHERDTKNRIEWWWSKLLWNLDLIKTQKYRPQSSLTRDPFIYFYTACVVLDRKEWIEDVEIPWWLYRPNTWRWRKYLITGKGYKKDYVILLDYYRALAAKK